MSKTTGIDEQILSLPKGGGAVDGIGTTFETDLNTGTGSYTIPINVPAGPNGIQPRITIRYHSAAGNGPFGIGWTMGLMAIARKTEGRIPDYGPDAEFVLVGTEDLVPVGNGRYRPRVDTLHWRIERQGNGWELTDTQGARYRLGQTAQARVETVEDGVTKVALWLLEEMEDTNGNTVHYFYREEGAQRYLERVEWGTYVLKFTYEERPDQLSNARYGFLLHTTLRCSSIELHVTTINPTLVRSWTLEYEQAPGSSLSLLHCVTMCGHAADSTTAEAPVLTLGYTTFRPRELERFSKVVLGITPGSFADGQLELFDWDGDGLPDILELGSGQARVWPNLGRGCWGYPRTLPALPAPIALDEPGVAFADMEGNGTADLIMLNRPLASYYPHRIGGGFDRPVYWRQAPSVRLADSNVRLVDLNGDGVTDLLVTGDNFFSLYYRDPSNGWEATPRTIPRSQVPPVSLEDQRVRLADMNGDGMQDLVRVDGAGVKYWPYLGNGRWTDAVEMANPPILPRHFDPKRLYLTDIDGDGCADLVYVDFDRVIYWLNQGGVRLGNAQEISYTPPAMTNQIRLADMKGTGTAGVLWSQSGTSGRNRHLYLDFTGGVKPYLLTYIDNGLGLKTHIRYRPSTEFAIDDAAEGKPWLTFHPFPVQCVAEVELCDTITGQSSVTRNHYHNGRYDDQSRTFLGFGVVETETVGDDSIPTLLTRNIYHLGLDPDDPERPLTSEERQRLGALRRRLLRTEVYGLDDSAQQEQPYYVVHHEYDTQVEPAEGGASVIVPFETRTLEEQWEREPAPFAFREITYLDIDTYGNILKQRIRVWRTNAPSPDLDITTETTFAIRPEAHIVSLPARVTQKGATGTILSAAVTHYDGLPHKGLPEGQVMVGNVTCQDILAISDDLATAIYGQAQPDWAALGYHRRPGENGWWVIQASYERQETTNGLTLITRGPRGFDTYLDYDVTCQYPKRLTDAANNVLQGLPDERTFQMASLTDANSNEVIDRFDPLGRVVTTIKPGDTEGLPTSIFNYRTDVLPVRVASFHRERHGESQTLNDYKYYNGYGKFIQWIVPGEGDIGRQFIMQETREYTPRGQVKARYLPYYVENPEYAPPVPNCPKLRMHYDALGRLIEQIKASGSRITQSFGPNSIEMLDEADNAGLPPTPLIHRLDGLKRVLSVEHHLTGHVIKTHYEYDALGQLVQVHDPDGGKSQRTYDLLGRILVEETPDTGRTVFILDASGNQVQRTTATGKTVYNTFDKLDRLVEVREEGVATPEIVYTYLDAGDPNPPDGIRNRYGRPWRIQDRLGTLTYAYDALGNVSQTRRSVNTLGGRELVTDLVYDAQGRQTQITLPEHTLGAGRKVVTYHYNARGLPESSPSYVQIAEYDVQGHLTRLVYQNGVENRLDFDLLTGRPQQMRVIGPNGKVLRDQTFTFDATGNLLQIDSPLSLEAGLFTYDELYRLTGATYGSGEHFAYTYSDGGNITWIEGKGNLTYGGPQGSSAVTAANGASYTYDADGHLQTAPYGTLQFDGLDNVVRVNLADGRRMDFIYDFQGRLAVKQVSDGSEIIFADPHLEFHNGQPIVWVTFGKKRIMALTSSGSVFLHADLLGTPTLYTDTDGKDVRRLAFGPYGTLRFDSAAGTGLPDAIRFTGQPFDAETGLICLGRRFYDPRLGRFISPDRVVPGIYLPDAWNRYIYGRNNPLRYTDPTGCFWADFFAALGMAFLVAGLIVAGAFTGGTTWAVAGVVITTNLGGLLVGTAIGVAAGAVLGGIAAGMAGGDIWAGILFGGFVGGVAAFAGGALGHMAFKGLESISLYLAHGISGIIQGTITGAGTGAAVGFAGGQGTVESIWTHIWKGAAIGAITGAALGLLSAYIQKNPWLQFGGERLNPNVPAAGGISEGASFANDCASIGQEAVRDLTGVSSVPGLGVFSKAVGFGAKPAAWSVNVVNLSWMPNVVMNWGAVALTTNLFIGLDKFNILDFDKVFVSILGLCPYFGGIIFTFLDDANLDWFEDMTSVFNMPEPG